MYKKICVIFLIIILTLFVSNCVFATDSFNVFISEIKDEIKPGEDVVIKLNVSDININATGINILEGKLNYNRDVFEEVTTADIQTEDSWQVTYNSDNGRFMLINYVTGVKDNMLVLTLNLKAKTNIKEVKNEEISITDIKSNNTKDIINTSSKNVNVKIVPDVIVDNNTDNANNNGSNNNGNNNNSNNNGNNNNGNSAVIDDTTAKGILPQTGLKVTSIIVLITISGITIISFIKHKKISKILMITLPLVTLTALKLPVEAVEYGSLKTYYYTINNDERIISRIEPNTDIEEFLDRFYLSDGNNIEIYSDGDKVTEGYVSTGMNAIYRLNQYRMSVVGDLDCDGEATQEELGYTVRHILEFEGAELTDIYYKSADVNGDSLVDQRDITKYIKFAQNGNFDLDKSDTNPPDVDIIVKEMTKTSILVEAIANDKEDGLENNNTYKFSIKNAKEIGAEFEVVQNTESNICNFENLSEGKTYTVKVETQDKAGNLTSKEKTILLTDIVPPIVNVNVEQETTCSVTVKASAIDNGGMPSVPIYEFYIKKANENNKKYIKVAEQNSGECTITNLQQGTDYIIRVVVRDKAGNETRTIQSVKTKSIPTDTITINNVQWNANTHKASVVVSTTSEGYTMQYSTDTTSWTNIISGNRTTEQSNNTTVYARLYDGTNVSKVYTEYVIKDNTPPTQPTLEVVSGTTDITGWYTSNVSVKVTDGEDSESGVYKTTYVLSGATTKAETQIVNNQPIVISNNGSTTITAYSYDCAENKSVAATIVINKDQGTPSYSNVSGQSKTTASHTHTSACKHTHTSSCYRTTYCSGSGTQVGYTYVTTNSGGETVYHHECATCKWGWNDTSTSGTVGNHGGSTSCICGKDTTTNYCGKSPVNATVTLQKATNMQRTRAKVVISNGTINSITWSGNYAKISNTEVIVKSGTVTCTVNYTAGTSTTTGTTNDSVTLTL